MTDNNIITLTLLCFNIIYVHNTNKISISLNDHTLIIFLYTSLCSSLSTTVTFYFLCTSVLSTTIYRIDHRYFIHIHSYNDMIWKHNDLLRLLT